MPRLKLKVIATVERRADAYALVSEPGDAVLVHRGHDRLFVLRCPCGCGEDIVTNLDSQAGRAWILYRTARGTSLFPSVWLEAGCASHFIIWDDRILLFGQPWGSWYDDIGDEGLDQRVLLLLRTVGRPADYRELAEQLSEIPWAVSAACRRLARVRQLIEVDEGIYALSAVAK